VKLHAIFLRDKCALPSEFVLHQERFCLEWMLVESFAALILQPCQIQQQTTLHFAPA
jgi:hypothetical protein